MSASNQSVSSDVAAAAHALAAIESVPDSIGFSDEAAARVGSHHDAFLTDLIATSRAFARRDGYQQASPRTVDEAVAQLRREQPRSEWLKWIGFFLLGIAGTLLIPLFTADDESIDGNATRWGIGLLIVALVFLLPALMIDKPWSAKTLLEKAKSKTPKATSGQG